MAEKTAEEISEELYSRKDFIVIDYLSKNGGFVVSCLADKPKPFMEMQDNYNFHIMRRFNENLAACIMFAVGAISAIHLFLPGINIPVVFSDISFTPQAVERIQSKKYRTARMLYPDLNQLKVR